MGHQGHLAGTGGGAAALVVRAADAEVVALPHSGSFRLLADGGAAGVNRLSLGAGSAGAPHHFHTRSTELFYVIGGAADFRLGTEAVRVTEGGLVLVPPGLTHAFGAAPGGGAELLVVLTPGVERFGYFRTLGRIQHGLAPFEELLPHQDRYDVHFAGA
ncbi:MULTISPECIES: cupin domain-containing protein [unclassified Streptomyces]|uniref:cupin domain-containing protein n=1 Tax=unclassified Streptomyces TaxID=2593676 RepID=UPI003329E643